MASQRALSIVFFARPRDDKITVDTSATPEVLLEHNIKLADKLSAQKKYSSVIKIRVKCVALSRIVYGDDDWHYSKSILLLAKAYHEHGGRHAQVISHASTCRDMLMRLQKGSNDLPVEVIKTLCYSHYLIGQSHLGEGLNADAEKAFLLATNVMQHCCKLVGGPADVQLQIKIANDLGKSYMLQKKVEKAKQTLQENLEFVEETFGADNTEAIPILHSLAMVAQLNSEYSKAVKLLKTAHSVTVHHYGSKSINMAASSQLLAGGYLLLWKHGDTELGDTRQLMEESLQVYQQLSGPKDVNTLKCHKEYCRLLVLLEEHHEAVSQLEQLISLEMETYGDYSLEVGKSYQLLGTIKLSMGDIAQANRSFSQCQQIYQTVLGSRHRETQAVMATLETLQLHDKATGKVGSQSEKPRFRTVV
ncbi:tetratricopeptide repeat protein 23-like isoform X3 [Dysidea avara]|uniref:tetratricopeptide repeat protein 23-like isoform X3 n=1 Tax=Dysidea avara TaxID=196820 RepID=UPI00332F055D